jgi:uncharacterized protein
MKMLPAAALIAAFTGAAHAQNGEDYLQSGTLKPVEPTGLSFNCMYAKMPDEVGICQSAELSAKDRQLADVYSQIMLRFRGGFRAFQQNRQADWLRERHSCGYHAPCIGSVYDSRIAELNDMGRMERSSTNGARREPAILTA